MVLTRQGVFACALLIVACFYPTPAQSQCCDAHCQSCAVGKPYCTGKDTVVKPDPKYAHLHPAKFTFKKNWSSKTTEKWLAVLERVKKKGLLESTCSGNGKMSCPEPTPDIFYLRNKDDTACTNIGFNPADTASRVEFQEGGAVYHSTRWKCTEEELAMEQCTDTEQQHAICVSKDIAEDEGGNVYGNVYETNSLDCGGVPENYNQKLPMPEDAMNSPRGDWVAPYAMVEHWANRSPNWIKKGAILAPFEKRYCWSEECKSKSYTCDEKYKGEECLYAARDRLPWSHPWCDAMGAYSKCMAKKHPTCWPNHYMERSKIDGRLLKPSGDDQCTILSAFGAIKGCANGGNKPPWVALPHCKSHGFRSAPATSAFLFAAIAGLLLNAM